MPSHVLRIEGIDSSGAPASWFFAVTILLDMRISGIIAGMRSIHDLTAALAVISDRQLHGLQLATNHAPNVVSGLLAWLEHAVCWEIDRRIGRHYPLQGPSAAIDTPEVAGSLTALAL